MFLILFICSGLGQTFTTITGEINKIVSTQDISVSLFNDWIFILELSSILLLATIVGCLTLLKFRKEID